MEESYNKVVYATLSKSDCGPFIMCFTFLIHSYRIKVCNSPLGLVVKAKKNKLGLWHFIGG